MDPDAALAQIRATVEAMRSPECVVEQRWLLAGDLLDLISGLDGWLSGGGFLPAAWTPGTFAPPAEPAVHWHGLRRCTEAHPWPAR